MALHIIYLHILTDIITDIFTDIVKMEIRKAAADKGILYIITDYVFLAVDEK